MPNAPQVKKTRNIAVNKLFPGKSRSAGVNEVAPKVSPPSGGAKDGKAPKKGVLTSGGGHG